MEHLKAGAMMVQKRSRISGKHTYKWRWFVLTAYSLTSFRGKTDAYHRCKSIPIASVTNIEMITASVSHPHMIRISFKHGFDDSIVLAIRTLAEREDWLDAIHEVAAQRLVIGPGDQLIPSALARKLGSQSYTNFLDDNILPSESKDTLATYVGVQQDISADSEDSEDEVDDSFDALPTFTITETETEVLHNRKSSDMNISHFTADVPVDGEEKKKNLASSRPPSTVLSTSVNPSNKRTSVFVDTNKRLSTSTRLSTFGDNLAFSNNRNSRTVFSMGGQ
eukprot:CFRG1867T1